MKKSMFKIQVILLILSIAIISCTQDVNMDKYKSMPKELADLCIQIDKTPENAELYTKRAQYYINKHQLDSAFTDALQAIKLDSNNSKRYNFLSDLYFMKGEFEASQDLLERSLQKNQNDLEAIMKLAELNLYYKQYGEMNQYLDKALTIDQRNPKAHLLKGFGLIEQYDTIGAIRELQLCVDQDPKYYEAYIQLGLIFHRKHNKLALNYYNNALNSRPQSTEALYNIAMFHQDTKNYDLALDQYKMILQIDANHKNANHNIGWIMMEVKKNYPEAIRYFTLSAKTDPMFENAIYNRGVAYEYLKKYDDAMLDYRKTLQINPSFKMASDAVERLKSKGVK